LLTRQADRGEHTVEVFASRPGKRHTRPVIIGAWRFADKDQPGARITVSEDGMAGRVAQHASVECGDGGLEFL